MKMRVMTTRTKKMMKRQKIRSRRSPLQQLLISKKKRRLSLS